MQVMRQIIVPVTGPTGEQQQFKTRCWKVLYRDPTCVISFICVISKNKLHLAVGALCFNIRSYFSYNKDKA